MKKTDEKPSFEQAMSRLEAIVGILESGGSGLDESIAAFEEGIGLLKYCNERLGEAEQKVRVLTENGNGETAEEPFAGSAQV